MTGRAINPLDYKDSSSTLKCAWVVYLLSKPSYLPGILVLAHSLKKYGSRYPLIVAINPPLANSEARRALEEAGLEVRVVEPLLPTGKVTTIAARFVDTWTKVTLFDFIEYDRLVLIDGDMMIRQNMDELFNIPLRPDEIAATFACICNLDKSSWAPDSWTKENCGFNPLHYPSAIIHPGDAQPDGPHSLLNSGLVVLTPSRDITARIKTLLSDIEHAEKVAGWMFPDQDLLAEVFRGRWYSIPWTYNALKTMRYWHGNFYRDEEVKNLHYICDKPWQRRPKSESVEGNVVYKVDAGDFKGIFDAKLGIPAEQADAVTHGWWWGEYEEMVAEMRANGASSIGYIDSLLDQSD